MLELGSDGVNFKGAGGVQPSVGPEDSRDFISASRVGGMVVVISGRGIVVGGSVAYEGIHL